MEYKLSENEFKNNLESTDPYVCEEILNFIKCFSCKFLMREPTYCTSCKNYVCSECNRNCKDVKLQISRHLKDYLDNISIRCKNKDMGCNKVLKYKEMFNHFSNCEFNKRPLNSNINNNNLNKNFTDVNINQTLTGENSLLKDIKINKYFFDYYRNKNSLISDNKKNKIHNSLNDQKFKCFDCNDEKEYNNIDKFIEHRNLDCKANSQKKNKNKTNENITFRDFEDQFNSYLDNCLNSLNDIELKNFEIYKKFFVENFKTYDEQNKKYENLLEIEKNLLSNVKKHNVANIPELKNVLKENKELLNKKSSLELELKYKINDLKNLTPFQNNKRNLNTDNKINNNVLNNVILDDFANTQQKKKIEELENMELQILKIIEESEAGLLTSHKKNNINMCLKCNDESPNVKKIICEECQASFCENKCAKICAGEICQKNNKYICPQHNNECSLCSRLNFCNLCKKKCYYNNCKNLFCPPCFKKNEHQTRNPNISCKFFTCERDNVNDCIMSSLFCQTCEKRICKHCIDKERDHFNYLK